MAAPLSHPLLPAVNIAWYLDLQEETHMNVDTLMMAEQKHKKTDLFLSCTSLGLLKKIKALTHVDIC